MNGSEEDNFDLGNEEAYWEEEYLATAPCCCPYCHCMNETIAGEICNDCRAGTHQG